MVHSRKRQAPNQVFEARTKYRTNDEILNACPYVAESGCWYLWLWSQILQDVADSPSFKVTPIDWAIYYPITEARGTMQEYKKVPSFNKYIVQIERCIELVEASPNADSYIELSEAIEAAAAKIAGKIPSLINRKIEHRPKPTSTAVEIPKLTLESVANELDCSVKTIRRKAKEFIHKEPGKERGSFINQHDIEAIRERIKGH
jgi:AraC-like DNA-binding protein